MKLFKQNELSRISKKIEQLENDVDRYEKQLIELQEKREADHVLMLDLLKRSIAEQNEKLEQDAREMQRELSLMNAKEQAIQDLINSALFDIEEMDNQSRTVRTNAIDSEILSLQEDRKKTVAELKQILKQLYIKHSQLHHFSPIALTLDHLFSFEDRRDMSNEAKQSIDYVDGNSSIDSKIESLKSERQKLRNPETYGHNKYGRVA
ncbi:MAG: hypothetical protein HQK63_14235 [Desulfamplus sp.]|nr:hypothetical protein [Desulfamplus sp.]